MSLPIGVLCVDRVKPTCTITTPASGATIGGTITFGATVADNDQVVSAQFLIDGVNYGPPATSVAPTLDTTTLGNGAHSFGAFATDRLGNVSPTSTVSATVYNKPPPPATPPPVPGVNGGVNSGETLTGTAGPYFAYGAGVANGYTLQFRVWVNFTNPEGKGALSYCYFDDGASWTWNTNFDAPANADQTTDWYGPWTNLPGGAGSASMRARLDLMRDYGGGSQTNFHGSQIQFQWV